jgi:integrase
MPQSTRMMRTVGAVLRKCVAWRILEYSPPMPMYRAPAPEARWLTRSQFAKLCKELPEHLKLAAEFAVYTMLRMRAMGQLTWDRVDLMARRAWVPSGHQKAGRTFGFPLSTATVECLRRLRALSPEGDRVFQYDGKPIDNFNTRRSKRPQSGPV